MIAAREAPESSSHRFDLGRRAFLKLVGGSALVGVAGRAVGNSGEPRRVEVAVVGAGLFGASAAMHLVDSGIRSVVLVGPPELAGGMSAAQHFASHYDESRNVTAMDADIEWARLAKSSIEPLRRLERRSRLEILRELGSLRVTQDRFARGYFALDGIESNAARLGIELTRLDSARLAARYPDIRFSPDSRGLLQERSAGLLRPRRLVAALRKVAIEGGASWVDAEVTRVEPTAEHVELRLDSGARIRARHVLVATGAAPIGHDLLREGTGVELKRSPNLPITIEVPDEFETKLPPTMITTAREGEFFGGFVAPPLPYPDGRHRIKVAGQVRSLVDGSEMADQVAATVRVIEHLFSLKARNVDSGVCFSTDSDRGRPLIEWVDSRLAVALAGNGKGAKAALEIGRRASDLLRSRIQHDVPAGRVAAFRKDGQSPAMAMATGRTTAHGNTTTGTHTS